MGIHYYYTQSINNKMIKFLTIFCLLVNINDKQCSSRCKEFVKQSNFVNKVVQLHLQEIKGDIQSFCRHKAIGDFWKTISFADYDYKNFATFDKIIIRNVCLDKHFYCPNVVIEKTSSGWYDIHGTQYCKFKQGFNRNEYDFNTDNLYDYD